MIRLVGLALILMSLVAVRAADAHEFPAPLVSVSLSSATPGGHPDLQTIFEAPTGAGFDQIRIVSPAGSGIASDGDIPDGTVVGRLDAEATTNAITLPECSSHVAFTVPIREATSDVSSESYPAYLRVLAPGPHRLRLVADVSPSPSIPILINYLFDVEPVSKSIVGTVFVGDPADPPEQFRSCTPQMSTNTLFGMTPAGTPLFTSPDPLPQPKVAFQYTFTSRADANGERHVQHVEAFASVVPTDRQPLVEPVIPSSPGGGAAAGSGIRLSEVTDGGGFYVYWDNPAGVEAFDVALTVETPGEPVRTRALRVTGAAGFDVPRDLLPACPGTLDTRMPEVTITVSVAPATQSGTSPTVEQRFGPRPGCAVPAIASRIVAPDAGSGPASRGRRAPIGWLGAAGIAMMVSGVALRRPRAPRGE
ncbi:MAG: hypothetical protein HY874_11445 [Chloroflexi bacterium]|nr:hypothetical protein [Chloroflexota bacterium]